MSKQVAITTREDSAFKNMVVFKEAMQMADVLSKSDIIPKDFANKPHNCLIALEYANRLGESPFVIMQNVSIINGKPGLSSKYLIARVNECGLFGKPLKFKYIGAKGAYIGCYAYTTWRDDGEAVEGVTITMEMAKAEGWTTRDRSKWKTMPEQMLMYRAASFFVDKNCPQLRFGMRTVEEVQDIEHVEIKTGEQAVKIDALNEKIAAKSADKSDNGKGKTNLSNDQLV